MVVFSKGDPKNHEKMKVLSPEIFGFLQVEVATSKIKGSGSQNYQWEHEAVGPIKKIFQKNKWR